MGEVGNSLIVQHSPSRGGSLSPLTWNRTEQQLFYSIMLTRIRTQDFDTILSCMHQLAQPKSLSWWGEVGNSLIVQQDPWIFHSKVLPNSYSEQIVEIKQKQVGNPNIMFSLRVKIKTDRIDIHWFSDKFKKDFFKKNNLFCNLNIE